MKSMSMIWTAEVFILCSVLVRANVCPYLCSERVMYRQHSNQCWDSWYRRGYCPFQKIIYRNIMKTCYRCCSGWTGVPGNCQDINECNFNNSGCNQKCFNTEGSYQCFCHPGYQLVNGITCVATNECALNNGGCEQICRNTPNGRQCLCESGYAPINSTHCTDIDECAAAKAGCDHICTNIQGGFQCSCRPGYKLKNILNCEVSTNCSVNNGECDQNCTDTISGPECSCLPGYRLEKGRKCVGSSLALIDNNDCLLNNGGCQHNCTNTSTGYRCSCRPGYKLVDGLKCVAEKLEMCIFPNRYDCIKCKPGFYPDKMNCDRYFICNLGGLVLVSCSKGTYWDAQQNVCREGRC